MNTAFASYDATRNFSNKAVRALCYAPHTNLFFDRLGSARVCCWNWSQPAGNVTTHSLDEIWASAQAAMLRDEMNAYRFAEGCGFCKFQAAEGWFGGAKMRNFDRFTVESRVATLAEADGILHQQCLQPGMRHVRWRTFLRHPRPARAAPGHGPAVHG